MLICSAAAACALALLVPAGALAKTLHVKFTYWFVGVGKHGHRVRPGGTFVHCASVQLDTIQAYGQVTGRGRASVLWKLGGRPLDPQTYRLFAAPWSWPYTNYSGLADGRYTLQIVQNSVPVGHASLRLVTNEQC